MTVKWCRHICDTSCRFKGVKWIIIVQLSQQYKVKWIIIGAVEVRLSVAKDGGHENCCPVVGRRMRHKLRPFGCYQVGHEPNCELCMNTCGDESLPLGNHAFSPMDMVQTAAIFIMALVRELKRLCSMGLRIATYRSREMAHRCMMEAVEKSTSR